MNIALTIWVAIAIILYFWDFCWSGCLFKSERVTKELVHFITFFFWPVFAIIIIILWIQDR